MSVSVFKTIRWRFIFIILMSAVLALLLLLLAYRFAAYLQDHQSNGSIPVRWVINNMGSTPAMIVTGSLLFLIFFFIFSKRVIRYLEEITLGIQEIAKGEFSHTIIIRSSDELGIVAENINLMSAQLKKSLEEERKAEKTKNDLITGVSHDLRTPLTSILGFLEYVNNDCYKDEVELRYYIGIAYEKSLSLKRLVHDLFEYTRINSKDLPLEFEELNIVDFLEQLVEEFVPALDKKGMTYELFASDKGLYVLADGDELVRAYENLISNAIQYGDEGTNILIHINGEQDIASVSITNKGASIPEQDLSYIFERFFRVDSSRSQSGGTGLGLAITKSIIELHGGQITVQSHAKLTTFTTNLPLSQ
ncbi:MAG TPA: HAMP domain-containing histidine kinase [Candidatus Paenibacillus intestinavium]|nr:HAMP domain-containing histidine kinase [Candidatus Paenibacillus intestinavium]